MSLMWFGIHSSAHIAPKLEFSESPVPNYSAYARSNSTSQMP